MKPGHKHEAGVVRVRGARVLLLALLLVMPVCMARAAGENAAPSEQPSAESLDIVRRVMRPWMGDFDDMNNRRLIRVLVCYGRSSYCLDEGQPRGITYEIFHEFDTWVNRRQGNKVLKIEVVFIPVRRDQLLPCLIEGKGDIAAANLTITDRRRGEVDFADPVLKGVRELVVTGPSGPALKSLDDLAGREVVVRKSSSYFDSLQKLNASFKTAGKREIVITPAHEELEDEDILQMVATGMMPATVVDNHIAELWAKVYDKLEVHDALAIRTGGEIAWAIRRNSPKLRAVLNEFVEGHRKGTTFGNVLFNRYLRGTKQVLNATSPEDARRFRTLTALFQKYANQYDFDWLLITAQAFQESRLDQSTRSQAGAVGVMQVLPSTAAAPPINIRDVDRLENNIHAGVAYLRHLRDQYFNDKTIDAFNQQLFTLASYNAGPARVARLRRKAAAMGLDPNRWFKNVEILAAREIGRETVDYVTNILIYYVAYQRLVTGDGQRARPLGG